jgi:heparosan-N-sulfate-glucuronate 5-epimerase
VTSGNRRRPALRAALIALLAAVAAGPAITPAAARSQPTVGTRQVIAPFMDTRAMPNRSLPRDARGVVLTDYGGTLGIQYNPVAISQAAITYYYAAVHSSEPLAQKNADREALLAQAEWLVSHQDSSGRWLYKFAWQGQPVPWVSAMAQGLGMSALIRANAIRPDPRYTRAIFRARGSFHRDWSLGGVGSWTKLGTAKYLVYEEYMRPYSPRTLNGWMFAMAGLYEASVYLEDAQARNELENPDRGYAALKALLPYYDTGTWSTYNLKTFDRQKNGTGARRHYHALHIRQLRWLARVTGDPFYQGYADRFQRYLDACMATSTCPA